MILINTAQRLLDRDPEIVELRKEHCGKLNSFNKACMDEERFLKQKAKVFWLGEGDGNTKFFHKTIRGRQNRSLVQRVWDLNNVIWEGDDIPTTFVEHYKIFLGSSCHVNLSVT